MHPLAAALLPTLVLLGGMGASPSGHSTTVIPLQVLYDETIALRTPDPKGLIEARVEAVNGHLAPVGVILAPVDVSPFPTDYAGLCEGPGSMFETLRAAGSAPGTLVLGVSGRAPSSSVVGCAMPDSYGTPRAVAVVRDPPYAQAPFGATPELRDHHAEVLYSHEIGHMLGGLHSLAWPQGRFEGAVGDIMYATLQFNVPRHSGLLKDGECVAPGNVCRMRTLIDLAADGGMDADGRLPPTFDHSAG